MKRAALALAFLIAAGPAVAQIDSHEVFYNGAPLDSYLGTVPFLSVANVWTANQSFPAGTLPNNNGFANGNLTPGVVCTGVATYSSVPSVKTGPVNIHGGYSGISGSSQLYLIVGGETQTFINNSLTQTSCTAPPTINVSYMVTGYTGVDGEFRGQAVNTAAKFYTGVDLDVIADSAGGTDFTGTVTSGSFVVTNLHALGGGAFDPTAQGWPPSGTPFRFFDSIGADANGDPMPNAIPAGSKVAAYDASSITFTNKTSTPATATITTDPVFVQTDSWHWLLNADFNGNNTSIAAAGYNATYGRPVFLVYTDAYFAGDLYSAAPHTSRSACGTGSSLVSGSDENAGAVNEGSAASGCTVTFAVAKVSAPFCVVSNRSGIVFSYAVSSAAITITNIGAGSSTTFDYHCVYD